MHIYIYIYNRILLSVGYGMADAVMQLSAILVTKLTFSILMCVCLINHGGSWGEKQDWSVGLRCIWSTKWMSCHKNWRITCALYCCVLLCSFCFSNSTCRQQSILSQFCFIGERRKVRLIKIQWDKKPQFKVSREQNQSHDLAWPGLLRMTLAHYKWT